jgi:hypothetical protein
MPHTVISQGELAALEAIQSPTVLPCDCRRFVNAHGKNRTALCAEHAGEVVRMSDGFATPVQQ